MPRLIDADKLKAHYSWWECTESGNGQKKVFDTIIDLQPTADVRENVHAHWVAINDARHPYRCSNCGAEFDVETMMLKPLWNFCPNCGAQMDEVTE